MVTQSVVDGLFVTQEKTSFSGASFFIYVLPPFACQCLMGLLVQLEGTRYYRLALLPIILWLAWRGTFVDMAGGDPGQVQANTVLVTHMCTISMRSTVWAFAREPFYRLGLSGKQFKSRSQIYSAFWNACDLMLNARGVGWSWSRRTVLPKPIFRTDSRTIFVLLSALQSAFHALAFDACLQTIRSMSPDTFGSISGGSLFDHSLPPFLELLRAIFVSVMTVCMAYFALQWSYYFLAIVGVVVCQQIPSQWPPLFDSPWLSTSLTELWGRRWHQMLRQHLVGLGVEPFEYLFGRFGGVFGAFLISGIFHDIELRSCGRGGNSVVVIGFWIMNSIGVMLERIWKKTTGRQVGTMWGWAWTFCWLALWGVPVVNEWAKAGRFGALTLPGKMEPSLALVEFVAHVSNVASRKTRSLIEII